MRAQTLVSKKSHVNSNQNFILRRTTLALIMAFSSAAALAGPPAPNQLPIGGVVTSGQATISSGSNTAVINQTTGKAAINWNSFSVGSNATVKFNQPDASSVTLNRVQSANPSQIYGNIQANGQIYLVNPSGIYFAPGANVNVGGIVATTQQMSDADFMSGKSTFSGSGGTVVNDGTIMAGLGGYIALLAPEVRNNGVLIARQGTVALAAGDSVTLNFGIGSRLDSVTVTPSQLKALVENKNAVVAPDGLVILSARAVNAIAGSVINSGTADASSVTARGGRIILDGDNVLVSGSLLANGASGGEISISGKNIVADTTSMLKADAGSNGQGGKISVIANTADPASSLKFDGVASAKGGVSGGDGGFVETSGSKVTVGASAVVDTSAKAGKSGQWLIDPHDFTIAGSGGDITGATLSSNLSKGSVAIMSSSGGKSGVGSIFVNDPVSWSANRLTLTAAKDVVINALMTASGTSGLTMYTGAANGGEAGVAGGNVIVGMTPQGFTGRVDFGGRSGAGILSINGVDYTVVNSAAGLQSIAPGGNYAIGSTIDLSNLALANNAQGWAPITSFAGNFNGLGNTVTGLRIYRGTFDNIGLFNSLSGNVRNLAMSDYTVMGSNYTGGLASTLDGGTVTNVLLNGSVWGNNQSGGMIGVMNSGVISNALVNGFVNSGAYTSDAGGMVGLMNAGSISGSGTNVAVTAVENVGGLVGRAVGGTISNTFATGMILNQDPNGGKVGGLIGQVVNATVDSSWSSGIVQNSSFFTGGLVGLVTGNANISNSRYFGPAVMGAWSVGGLVGQMEHGTIVNSSASQGDVHGTAAVGGVVGSAKGDSSVTDSSAMVRVYGDVGTTTSVGGFVGDFDTTGTYARNYATGVVSGSSAVGGFVGYMNKGMITDSYATGYVTATAADSFYAGGFAGRTYTPAVIKRSYATGNVGYVGGALSDAGGFVGYHDGAIEQSFSTGNVSGTNEVGGFVGQTGGRILNAYATGSVFATPGANEAGGFVGINWGVDTIVNAYSTGSVIGGVKNGGFAGGDFGRIASSFWNVTTSGSNVGTGAGNQNAVGKTTAQMMQLATFTNAGWGADATGGTANVWRIYEGNTSPLLRTFMTPAMIGGKSATLEYSGLSASPSVICTTAAGACTDSKILGFGGGGINVGTYGAPPVLYSNQFGYDLSYGAGLLTVTPAPLTITANDQSKTAGSAVTFTGTEFSASGLKNGETVATVSLASAGAPAAAAPGPYAITPSAAMGGTFAATNYSISYVNGLMTVNPAPVAPVTPVEITAVPIAPPVVTPTVVTPPVVTPPVVTPPVVTPPVVTPPVVEPPVVTPPTVTPPAFTPPVATPPASNPPTTTPPVNAQPVVTSPALTQTPVNPVVTPPATMPAAGNPLLTPATSGLPSTTGASGTGGSVIAPPATTGTSGSGSTPSNGTSGSAASNSAGAGSSSGQGATNSASGSTSTGSSEEAQGAGNGTGNGRAGDGNNGSKNSGGNNNSGNANGNSSANGRFQLKR